MVKINKGKQFILALETRCSNNCIFCQDKIFEYPLTSMSNYVDAAQIRSIKDRIETASRLGFADLYITGQEPLAHPRIVEFVIFARKHSFNEITIQTTARKLKSSHFLLMLIKAGVSEFHIPIYGSNKKIHETITRGDGSYGDLIKALDNLSRFDVLVGLNSILLRKNYKDLPELAGLISKRYPAMSFSIDHYRHYLSSVAVYKENMIRYRESVPYLKKTLDNFLFLHPYSSRRFLKFAKNFIEMPFCIINELDRNLFKYFISQLKMRYGYIMGLLIGAMLRDRTFPYSNREKLSFCNRCIVNAFCLGPYNFYLKAYGESEFYPISN